MRIRGEGTFSGEMKLEGMDAFGDQGMPMSVTNSLAIDTVPVER